MATPSTRPSPAGYRLRVKGHLDRHWSAWLGDLSLTHESDGTTSIGGVGPDQAELHGLLAKVRDLGVILISVQVVDPAHLEESPGTGRPGPQVPPPGA